MNIYIKNTDGFTEITVPTFTNYETMVSTCKDIVTILDGMNLKDKDECLRKTEDCIETLRTLQDYYTSNETFDWNIAKARMELELNIAYNVGVNGKKVWVNRWNGKMVRSLARGVVRFRYGQGFDYGRRYWHLTDPKQDVYEYNGRNFYLWDGWHSSPDVMAEIADKQFNN